MSDLKVGDVVWLKSQQGLDMTVAEITDDGVVCIYFSPSERNFVRTIPMPNGTLTKVENLD